MTIVKNLIAALQTLPESWTVHQDNIGHFCISDDAKRIVGFLDIATGEIDRWDDSESP